MSKLLQFEFTTIEQWNLIVGELSRATVYAAEHEVSGRVWALRLRGGYSFASRG